MFEQAELGDEEARVGTLEDDDFGVGLIAERGGEVLQVLDHGPVHNVDGAIVEDCAGDVAPWGADGGDGAVRQGACYRCVAGCGGGDAGIVVEAWDGAGEGAVIVDGGGPCWGEEAGKESGKKAHGF